MRAAASAVLRSYGRDRIIRKRLPPDLGGGVVFCSPDALLSTWKPGWRGEQARHLFDWARWYVKPGDVIWDLGANQGLFTFAALGASGPTGRAVAFEPDPFLAGLLYRTRNAQRLAQRLDVLPLAVAGSFGVADFSIASKDRALNHLAAFTGNPHTWGERDRLAVVTVTLEWLASQLPAPNVIKVDVEGAERAVLEGAGTDLLTRIRPAWIVEVAAEHAAALTDILRRADYRLFDASKPGRALSAPAWNTLALPAERTH